MINWNAPFAWVLFYLDSRPLSSSRGSPRQAEVRLNELVAFPRR